MLVEQPNYLEIRWEVEKWMLLRLTNFGTQLSFGPGEVIITEGERDDGLYLVLAGVAQVTRRSESGATETLGTLGPFRSFGEVSLLVDHPRTATVVATGPLRCVKLTRRQLAVLEEREPALALRLYRLVAESLARSLLSASGA